MIEAYTPEWWQARLGKVTASRISDVVAKKRDGDWGASRANYAAELIAERLTGRVAASYSNAAMEWGSATEPEALIAYRFFTDADVVPAGFVQHPKITMSGGTPDGAVYGKAFITGLVEIKCPNTKTHIETLRKGNQPREYFNQCLWQMACVPTAAWVDYVSFDPRMPEDMQLFVKRVYRDEVRIAELEDAVCVFLSEIERDIGLLWARTNLTNQLRQSLETVE